MINEVPLLKNNESVPIHVDYHGLSNLIFWGYNSVV